MPDEIDNLRREIDALDDQLAALLNRRAGLAQRIGALKSGAPAYRPEREIEILRRITKNPGVLPAERVAAVFREVISACRGLEEAIRVSYLGPEGTFSEQAVRKHFGRAVEGQQVRELPLNGENFMQLVTLSPGDTRTFCETASPSGAQFDGNDIRNADHREHQLNRQPGLLENERSSRDSRASAY